MSETIPPVPPAGGSDPENPSASSDPGVAPQLQETVDPAPVPQSAVPFTAPDTGKSFVATWLLAWLVGVFGIDRFYLGKVGTGILKLITGGGVGIWWLIDLILVLAGATRDRQGRALAGYEKYRTVAWIVTGAGIVLGIILGSVNAAAGGGSGAPEGAPVVPAPAAASSSDAPSEPSTPPSPKPVPQKPTVQSWADDTFGTFAPVTQTGSGDSVIALPAGAKAGIVAASYQGSGNFIVNVLDANNQPTGDLLVNTIGAYQGTTAYGFRSMSQGVSMEVKASGDWSITIAPVSQAPALAASGAGDGVFLYDGTVGQLTATHDGAANFVVTEHTGQAFQMGLLINVIGPYSGTVPLSAGPAVISIVADGNWTMAVG